MRMEKAKSLDRQNEMRNENKDLKVPGAAPRKKWVLSWFCSDLQVWEWKTWRNKGCSFYETWLSRQREALFERNVISLFLFHRPQHEERMRPSEKWSKTWKTLVFLMQEAILPSSDAGTIYILRRMNAGERCVLSEMMSTRHMERAEKQRLSRIETLKSLVVFTRNMRFT